MDESGGNRTTGKIAWVDLTVRDASRVRDFYMEVVGWRPSEVDMGGYSDYGMSRPDTGETVAGVCHARGANADLPAQWLIYITVDDVEKAAATATRLGGVLLRPPTPMGGQGRYCVIRDPGGAVAALCQQE